MKSLIKKLLKEALLEATKKPHYEFERYPERIERSTLKDMDNKHRVEIDNKLDFIESLEFLDNNDTLGIWIHETSEYVFHEPHRNIDKGKYLLLIVRDNELVTLFWPHIKRGNYDYDVSYEDLLEMSNSEFYNPINKPISIKTIKQFLNSKTPKINQSKRDKFKKIKLLNGDTVRYYTSNKFETLNGNELNINDVFEELPEELQKVVLSKM